MKCVCGIECTKQEETWVQDENDEDVYFICGHGYMVCTQEKLAYFREFVETKLSRNTYAQWYKEHKSVK